MTFLGQKFCMVVYPAEEKSSGSREEAEEMKEVKSPLSTEDDENHRSVD